MESMKSMKNMKFRLKNLKPVSSQQLLRSMTVILFAGGMLGIAFKFTTLFDQWIYFPKYPNFIDTIFLMVGTIYLSWRALRHE